MVRRREHVDGSKRNVESDGASPDVAAGLRKDRRKECVEESAAVVLAKREWA
jgi:hypothetical protein